jgi:hypothetical protein
MWGIISNINDGYPYISDIGHVDFWTSFVPPYPINIWIIKPQFNDGYPLPSVFTPNEKTIVVTPYPVLLPLWYTDETKTNVTIEDKGEALKVLVPTFENKLTKLEISFFDDGTGTKIPKIILGSGTEGAGSLKGKGVIWKAQDGLRVDYFTGDTGVQYGLLMDNGGIHFVRDGVTLQSWS